MFPYTATAAKNGCSTRPFVVKCSAVTLAAAALMAAVYLPFGRNLLALLPHGAAYGGYAPLMPWLAVATAMTTCQVFYANAEVSAGRFGFLWWLVPLHVVYPVALWICASHGLVATAGGMVAWIFAISCLRFAFAAAFSRA